MNNNKNSFKNGIAGLIAHLSTGVLYPLELIKIRLQVNEQKIKFTEIIKNIYIKEGLQGFYRGFYFSIIIGCLANALFFWNIEYLNQKYSNKNENYKIKNQFLISYISGLSVSLLTIPLWTIRTRLSLLQLDKKESLGLTRLRYSFLLIKECLFKEGIFKLYKGIFASFLLSLNGGVQMTIYETAKQFMKKNNQQFSEQLGSTIGIISKLLASFILYPFNLLRSKQQQFNKKLNINERLINHSITSNIENDNFIKTSIQIYNKIGLRGFYQGITPLIIRQIPSSAIFFYTYESTLNILNKYS